MATQKWSLEDIRPPERKTRSRTSSSRTRAARSQEPAAASSATPPKKRRPSSLRRGGGKRRVLFAIGAVALFMSAAAVASMFASGATLTLYPKYRDVTLSGTFTASQTPTAGALGFELLTLEAEGERVVTPIGQEEVRQRATGSITVFNEVSTASQRLIRNTRFAAPEGLIFRIDQSIEVPGYTQEADGTITPGSITVEVFADDTGAEYNLGPTRFSIPGLEGTEQFEGMYAQSQERFTGGFEGPRFIVDEDELARVTGEVQNELEGTLRERLQTERPSEFVLFEEAVTISFETLPATEHGTDRATIKERARLEVPLFSNQELAGFIARQVIAGYDNEPVAIEDYSFVRFAFAENEELPLSDLSFTLSGTARVVWTYDEQALTNDLAGLSKTALPAVLSGYPALERAEAVVRPFWRQSFPRKAEDISVVRIVGE